MHSDTYLGPIDRKLTKDSQYNARESSPLGSNRMFSRSASLRRHSSLSKNAQSA